MSCKLFTMNPEELCKMIDKAEPTKKKSVKRYTKPKSVKRLEEAVNDAKVAKAKENPDAFPYPAKQKFTDKDANGLTKCIIAYIGLCKDCYAYRVNNTGVFDPKTGKFRTSNTVSGIADITGCIQGKFVQIEVKHGKDRMSEGQKKFKAKVEGAKGVYFVAKTFDSFLEDFRKLFIG